LRRNYFRFLCNTGNPISETSFRSPRQLSDVIGTPDAIFHMQLCRLYYITHTPISDKINRGDEMIFAYIDAHADTITSAMEKNFGLHKNDLHIDFARLAKFDAPIVQIFAICVTSFAQANSAIDFFERELKTQNEIKIARSFEEIKINARNKKSSALLSLEGGEPLAGKIENLFHFYERGVRLVTLTWNRENELGFGVGADCGRGLKPFGVEVVKKMNQLGMIIDVSHLNEQGFRDVDAHSTKPFIASHSNAFSVLPHKRNLTDKQIQTIAKNGGVIGINFCPAFLQTPANLESILKHIEHFISLGAEKNIVLGTDFDGVASLPEGITDVTSLTDLKIFIAKKLGENISQKIFAQNFFEFFKQFF
jgi:membrane dipeptidase